MLQGQTLKEFTLEQFIKIASPGGYRYVPESNVDIFIRDAVSINELNRKDEMVHAFLLAMYSNNTTLSNFRVVYPVSQSCCVFWRPSIVKLHYKTSPGPGGGLEFSSTLQLKSLYLKSVVVDVTPALSAQRLVDYGAMAKS